MATTPVLYIEFCDHAATIHCQDESLRAQISRYFQHHLTTETAPIAVTYHIIRTGQQWQLLCNGQFLHAAPERFLLFSFLQGDLVAQLVNRTTEQSVIHAAGVAEQDTGIILCGPSGSGKSTLAAWLTHQGYDFLSDEMIALNPTADTMSGLRVPLVLHPDSAFVWQNLSPAMEQINQFDEATWLYPEALRPGCVRRDSPPQLLIFPQYHADMPLTAEPLTPAAAAFQLLPRFINGATRPDAGFAIATMLTRRLPSYHLRYPTLATAQSWLTQTVASLR